MASETAPQNLDSLRQVLRDALRPLAAIDPNGPEFNRPLDIPIFPPDPSGRGPIPPTELHWVATVQRGGRTAILRRADVERARACLADDAATVQELAGALRPLALLPVDAESADDRELCRIGGVVIQGGQVRAARRLVVDTGFSA